MLPLLFALAEKPGTAVTATANVKVIWVFSKPRWLKMCGLLWHVLEAKGSLEAGAVRRLYCNDFQA